MKYPFNIEQCDAFIAISGAGHLGFHSGRLVFSMGDYFCLECLIWLALFIHFSKLLVHFFNAEPLQTASASERRELCLGHNASTVLALRQSTYLPTHLACLSPGKSLFLETLHSTPRPAASCSELDVHEKSINNNHCGALCCVFKPHIDNLVKNSNWAFSFEANFFFAEERLSVNAAFLSKKTNKKMF